MIQFKTTLCLRYQNPSCNCESCPHEPLAPGTKSRILPFIYSQSAPPQTVLAPHTTVWL